MPFIAIALAVASAGLGVYGAQQQNQAVRRSMQARNRQAEVQNKQIAQQAAVEKMKARNEAARIRGRIRVAGAESGAGLGGTFAQLLTQADYEDLLNESIINTNRDNAFGASLAGLQVDMSSLSAQGQSPLIAAFQGGLSGLSTGLAIEGALADKAARDRARQEGTI
jgi:hypothetical protein